MVPCLLQEISDLDLIWSDRHWVCNPFKAQN